MGEYTKIIGQDPDPMNPRTEFENFGTILYISNKYFIGDKKVIMEEIEEIVKRDDIIYLPVYAYIHGSVMLSTEPYNDKFDSGQCGIIYIEKDKINKEFSIIPENEREEAVRKELKGEIDTFSKYLSGEVYYYEITKDGESISSCYGFYDRNEAESAADEAIAIDKVNVDEGALHKTTIIVWSKDSITIEKLKEVVNDPEKFHIGRVTSKIIYNPYNDSDCDRSEFFNKR
jgi:hypothetical protein